MSVSFNSVFVKSSVIHRQECMHFSDGSFQVFTKRTDESNRDASLMKFLIFSIRRRDGAVCFLAVEEIWWREVRTRVINELTL